jgi:hypothetical protein
MTALIVLWPSSKTRRPHRLLDAKKRNKPTNSASGETAASRSELVSESLAFRFILRVVEKAIVVKRFDLAKCFGNLAS